MDSDVTDMNTLTVSPWHLYSSHFQYILECLVLKSPTSLYRPYFNVKYFINFNIVLQFSGSWFLTTCILCLKYLWKHVVAIPCFIFLFYTYHICYNIREQVPSPSLIQHCWSYIFVAKTTFFKLSGFPVIPLNTPRLVHRKAMRFSSQNPHQEIRSECRESFSLSHESCTQVISPHLLAIWLKPPWSKCFKATFSREPVQKTNFVVIEMVG